MAQGSTLNLIKEYWQGLLLAVLIGIVGYGVKVVTKSPMADPLLIAMMLGIIVRTAIGDRGKLKPGFTLAPTIFIPLGIVFYAANNLNFLKFAEVETDMIVLLIIIMLVYFAVILLLGKLLRQRKQITYLTATGSAICGASAIAITSPAVEAEPDDISISLLSVALAAFVGLFIIFPFLATLFDITGESYGLLSGSVLQFTGFVKVAVENIPYLRTGLSEKELVSLALSVKAVRYLGLLIAIPLFASLIKKRLYIPWVLWAFLISGLIGTGIYAADEIFYNNVLLFFIEPIYSLSWSIALAAIGLNANVKELLSNEGTKALIMAFAGFFAATITFFIGLYIIG
ncbi:hypothetical protein BMS3Abin16_00946 [archaeon BMS3Abin16]|nr:hypothetical protein BMS3Abin16_00946 [archaeon BMS3Abin16]GBE55966.1 hypothetical protein BMS3Bbin16_00163 [archaeon BMS3Bbin16]HDY73974.1 putative sulfate exporter family transporter [Euryarchaeota archaeon]